MLKCKFSSTLWPQRGRERVELVDSHRRGWSWYTRLTLEGGGLVPNHLRTQRGAIIQHWGIQAGVTRLGGPPREALHTVV